MNKTFNLKIIFDSIKLVQKYPWINDFIQNTSEKSLKKFYQDISGVFGIDEGEDFSRFNHVYTEILPILEKLFAEKNETKIEEIKKILSKYCYWTATGGHRFIPLLFVVNNLLKHQPLFSNKPITDHCIDPASLDYLSHFLPNALYPESFLDPQRKALIQNFRISFRSKFGMEWLDIGSAPKKSGSPTLNLMHQHLKNHFKFRGVDVLMPYFDIQNNQLVYSDFVNPRQKKWNTETKLNNIHYYLGTHPKHSIFNDSFFNRKKFDVISLCMTFHHLKKDGEKYRYQTFSDFDFIDQKGRPLSQEHWIHITESQKNIVNRLLNLLRPGGLLFLDPHTFSPSWTDDPSIGLTVDLSIKENHHDLIFIIQKKANNNFQLFDQTPIQFRPNNDRRPYPLLDINIQYHYSRSKKFEELINSPDVIPLIKQADQLALLYQSWKKGVYGRVEAVIQLLKQNPHLSLKQILLTYLAHVPDNHIKKKEILSGAERYHL